MTPPDEPNRDDPGTGTPPDSHADGDSDQDDLDYDALFQAIVDGYGERPVLDPAEPDADEPADEAPRLPDPGLFDTTHLSEERPSVEQAWHRSDRSAEREEHFVPPEPPPVPRATPARRVAWSGLFLAPVAMLAAVALGWVMPDWFSMLLVAAFVGGFVFLVATMPRDRRDDGDDGAVV
jgi:hypothetical protein